MTEPRKLGRGSNSRTALVDFIKSQPLGDPREDGVRVKGDVLDSIIGTASSSLGSEHATRRIAPNTFQGNLDHSRKLQRTPSQPVVTDPTGADRTKAKQLLGSLSEEDRQDLLAELDQQESDRIIAEAEAEQASELEWYQAAERLPWEGPDGKLPWEGPAYTGYYEVQDHARRVAEMSANVEPDYGYEFDIADFSDEDDE